MNPEENRESIKRSRGIILVIYIQSNISKFLIVPGWASTPILEKLRPLMFFRRLIFNALLNLHLSLYKQGNSNDNLIDLSVIVKKRSYIVQCIRGYYVAQNLLLASLCIVQQIIHFQEDFSYGKGSVDDAAMLVEVNTCSSIHLSGKRSLRSLEALPESLSKVWLCSVLKSSKLTKSLLAEINRVYRIKFWLSRNTSTR